MELQLHQTLHGYADGHQLLRGSIGLPSTHESQMLLLSDLSGPEYRGGFDGYLTGYPLEGSGYYVIARTWFAPEMPRPGCVWTHSVLIRDEDLSRIRSLGGLPFVRPKIVGGDATYDEPIRVDLDEKWIGRKNVSVRLASVLEALYSTAATVVIPASSCDEYEEDFLAIFLQQWPRLRRSFRFCSGALMPRERNFDLVATPHDALLGVERRDGFVVPGAPARPLPWATFALQDLEDPDTEYRQFLWKFGPDFSSGRRVFSLLTEACLASRHVVPPVVDAESMLEKVGRAAPQPSEAPRLKALLFSPDGVLGQSPENDLLFLRQLLLPSSSLEMDTIGVTKRVNRLAETAPESLGGLFLEAAQSGAVAAQEMMATCRESAMEDRLDVHAWPEPAVALLIKEDPRLSAKPNVWLRVPDKQTALFRLALEWVTDEKIRMATQVLFFTGGFHEVAELGAAAWPSEAVRAFLASIANERAVAVPAYVDKLLDAHADVVAKVVCLEKLTPLQLRLAASYLDPLAAAVRHIPANTWLPCANSGAELEPRLELRAKTLLLVMGLRATSFDGSPLLGESFPSVYSAVARELLKPRQWEAIAHELPRPSYGWDNCKWLVRSAVEFFVQRAWPLDGFVRAFGQQEETWRRAVRQLRRSYEGSLYLGRLRDAHRRALFALPEQLSHELHREPWWWQT